jgi:hypothetical protein
MEEKRRAAAMKIQRYWRAYAGRKLRQKLKLKVSVRKNNYRSKDRNSSNAS